MALTELEREAYAAELRARREEAGLTQQELAKLLLVHPSLVAHWEAGRRVPGPRDAKRLDHVLDTGGTFVRFLERNPFASHFARASKAEAQAVRIEEFAPVHVPGLLQTGPYARAVFRAHRLHWETDELDRVVHNRLRRARILDGKLPEAWFILSEAVVRTAVGGPGVMAEQLGHLAELVRRERVNVQVVPFAEGAHAAMGSMLTLMKFGDSPDLAYVEGLYSGNVMDANAADHVQLCRDAYDMTRAAALSPTASLHMIEAVTEEYTRDERTLRPEQGVVAQVQLQRR